MVYPYITQTKLQVRLCFLEEKHKAKWNAGNEHVYDENGEWQRKPKAIEDAIRRAKRSVVDYALNNDFEYFGTITFDDKLVDIHTLEGQEKALDQILNWCNNYRERVSPDFRYELVPEYGGKKGRLHFHFLLKGLNKDDLFINENKHLDFLPFRQRFGFVQITKIGDNDNDKRNVAFYCSKYITKNNIQLRSHRYFCSKDLKLPTKYCMDDYYFTVAFQEWLANADFNPYFDSKIKRCVCYSIPARVFFAMLQELGIFFSRKSGVVLYEGFESAYMENPFELRQEEKIIEQIAPVQECIEIGEFI